MAQVTALGRSNRHTMCGRRQEVRAELDHGLPPRFCQVESGNTMEMYAGSLPVRMHPATVYVSYNWTIVKQFMKEYVLALSISSSENHCANEFQSPVSSSFGFFRSSASDLIRVRAYLGAAVEIIIVL